MRVECVAKIGGEERCVETARAVDTALLGDGEDNLEIAVWDVMLLQAAQRLKDGNHARLVVRTEDGCAVGADDTVL